MSKSSVEIKEEQLCYKKAEGKAEEYFQSLYNQVKDKKYVTILTSDILWWQKEHLRKKSLGSWILNKKENNKYNNYESYIQWLTNKNKLDKYLERSISYIFMRDLGKDLSSPDTESKVRKVVSNLKYSFENSNYYRDKKHGSMATLYRQSQKEGVESDIIWLINKLKTVFNNLPEGINAEEAKRKLIKIIAGVIMHQFEELDSNTSKEQRREKLSAAIRLGYYYGLTYPFIDDLLDAKVLSISEKEQYSNLIRTTLTGKVVPNLENWNGDNYELVNYVYGELKEAFEYIREYQDSDNIEYFFEQSYIFFNSQEIDRNKELSNEHYTNEDLYVPIILKSSSSRLIVRSVISASEDKGFENRTFYYGIYNQLADDFTDMFEDMKNKSVTPYTYYMKYHNKRPDLINPFELYWTVISNLIHNVYNSDKKTCEVILCRAINSLKRFKARIGEDKYNEIMNILDFKNTEFTRLIQQMVEKAEDVEFFDKLLRDYILEMIKNGEKDKEEFKSTIKIMQKEINQMLYIDKMKDSLLDQEIIREAANYSIEGNGKRLRPIMCWSMGIYGYGLKKSTLIPLVKSLEYMHTASLIYDDLPSQDNAAMRRGHKTLHEVYNVAIAELTSLFLTQKAIEEQASLDEFDSKSVLKLIKYSTQTIEKMCIGQALDLHSKHEKYSLEEISEMCFYKTGIAFEASIVMPAILGKASEDEIKALKDFAYHAGIAFQIKDDILDVEGDSILLGKLIGKDAENNNSTFVSMLGLEEAKKHMWEHYCEAMEVLKQIPRNTSFLNQLMNYVVNRES